MAAVGIVSVLFLFVALATRWTGPIPWALAAAGGQYAAFLVIREGTIDAWAPLYGAALLLSAELCYWSIERTVPGDRPGFGRRRASLIGAAVLAAGGVGGVILSASELSVSGGIALEALGVAAAVGALALVAWLARPERRG